MLTTWAPRWRPFWTNSRNLGRAWLATAGILALYAGAIHPQERVGGISNSRATGLAAEQVGPLALWRERRFSKSEAPLYQEGVSGGIYRAQMMDLPSPPRVSTLQDVDKDRKVIRTGSIDLIVQRPAESAEKIRSLAENLGGFLVSSQITGGQDATSGSLTIRVPAARFGEARAAIHRLGLRVESERVDAQDVTRQYVDQAAALRNLTAEEEQYLSILKQARTVNDTLQVTGKLSAIRGEIEQQRAEFEALSKQIETVSMTITLRTEAEAQVFGLRWRPLYQIKLAFRDGLESLASYASTVTEFAFFLPTVLLWLATILAGAALGWRLLRWMGRRVFRASIGSPAAQG